jgi:hypothetical protein
MMRHVVSMKSSNVSDEHIAFIFGVEWAMQDTGVISSGKHSLIDPEGAGDTLLRNVGWFSAN